MVKHNQIEKGPMYICSIFYHKDHEISDKIVGDTQQQHQDHLN